MTASATSVYEGAAIIYTLTASAPAPTGGTSVDFSVVAGDTAAANQGTGTTNLNDFAAGAFNPSTVVIAAGATTATYSVTSATDTLTELPESYSVKAVIGTTTVATKTTSLLDGAVTSPTTGTTYTLTTGVDTPGSTALDDTYSASALTFTPVDAISAGLGTDTMTWIETTAIAGTPAGATITGLEILNVVNGGTAGANSAVTLDTS